MMRSTGGLFFVGLLVLLGSCSDGQSSKPYTLSPSPDFPSIEDNEDRDPISTGGTSAGSGGSVGGDGDASGGASGVGGEPSFGGAAGAPGTGGFGGLGGFGGETF